MIWICYHFTFNQTSSTCKSEICLTCLTALPSLAKVFEKHKQRCKQYSLEKLNWYFPVFMAFEHRKETMGQSRPVLLPKISPRLILRQSLLSLWRLVWQNRQSTGKCIHMEFQQRYWPQPRNKAGQLSFSDCCATTSIFVGWWIFGVSFANCLIFQSWKKKINFF